MSYYIRVPEPIISRNLATGETANEKPLPFRAFVVGTLLADKRAIASFKAMRNAHAIAAEAEAQEHGGQWMVLDDSAYELLKSIAEEPQGLRQDGANGYPGAGFIQVVPFIKAIMDAKSERPAELTEVKA